MKSALEQLNKKEAKQFKMVVEHYRAGNMQSAYRLATSFHNTGLTDASLIRRANAIDELFES